MPLSYNEEVHQTSELRHLFLPAWYMVAAEATVAVMALLLLNLSTLSNSLGGAGNIEASPLSLWSRVFGVLLSPSRHASVQQVLLFTLWALVGVLVYILVFRFLQLFVRARSSVHQGVAFIQADHSRGIMRYFASLHDFFARLIIGLLGTVAILTGALLCFTIASQQLSAGLSDAFPASLSQLALALIGAFIAVRVITVGVSLLSSRFRDWYNA